MSGPLAQHCPAQVPTDEIIGVRTIMRPGGLYENGRCVEWRFTFEPRYRMKLVPRIEPNRVSKHARGRIRPRTKAEQTRARNLAARFTQISKTVTIDHNRMRAIHDEVAA